MNRIAQTTTTTPGDMRVWISGPLGLKIQPLTHAKTGGTVEATVYVDSIKRSRGGRAHGLVRNNTGTAIFTVASDFLPRLDSILQDGASVKIRGTVTRVGQFPTIDVYAARSVNV
jgi:hypothetical protein